jgi:hypothetical protein
VGNDTTEYAIGWNADGTDGIGGLVLPTDMFAGMNGVVSTPTMINAPVLLGTILANLSDVANIGYRVLQGLVDFGSAADSTLGTNTKNTLDKMNTAAQDAAALAQILSVAKPNNPYLAALNVQAAFAAESTAITRAIQAYKTAGGMDKDTALGLLSAAGNILAQTGAIASLFPHPAAQLVARVATGLSLAIAAAQFGINHPELVRKAIASLANFLSSTLSSVVPPFNSLYAGLFAPRDPLVVNFAAGLPNLTPLANSPTYFDYSGQGFAVQTGWVGPQAGLLEYQDSAGALHLLGASSGSGFADLIALDSDGDSRIDANDAAYSQLLVWIDSNGNGQVDSGELLTLVQAGISAIDLNVQTTNARINGNTITESATFEYSSGEQGGLYEVNFATNSLRSIYTPAPNFQLDEAVYTLPELRGYGLLPDLSIAMTLDPTLEGQVSALVSNASSLTAAQFKAAFANILYQWAGVAAEDPTSRGPNVDARQYDFLLKLYGVDPTQTNAYTAFDPNGIAGSRDTRMFSDIMNEMMVRFFAQIGTSLALTSLDFIDPQSALSEAFSPLNFDPTTDGLSFDLKSLLASIANNLPADSASAQQYLDFASLLLGGLKVDAYNQDGIGISQLGLRIAMFAEAAGLSADAIRELVQPIAGATPAVTDLTNIPSTFSIGAGANVVLLGSSTGAPPDVTTPLTVTGNNAADAYVYLADVGRNVVLNDSGAVIDFADLAFSAVVMQRIGSDLVVTVAATGQTLTVKNQFANAALQQISFSDGMSLDREGIGETAPYIAGDGDVTLIAEDGTRTLVAGAGNDTLLGGLGRDTFVYSSADGDLSIGEHWQWYWGFGGTVDNTLKLTDLNVGDLTFSRVDATLLITVNATGKVITVGGNFGAAFNAGIETIQFADGTSWGRAEIANAAWYRAGPGDVTVQAQDGDAVLVDGRGNDTLVGGLGRDTFVYSAADGDLSITENWRWYWGFGGTVDNTLKFTDLNAGDLTFSRVDATLLITVNATGKVITVGANFGAAFNAGIETIQFADGTSWGRTDIAAAAWYRAGPGDITIQAQDGPAVLVAGPGNDTFIAGSGQDTFVYASGDGNLVVTSEWRRTNGNTLKFTDLNVADLSFTHDDLSLVVTVNATGKTITLDKEFFDDMGVQSIQFADGTVWAMADFIAQGVYRAGPGDVTVQADAGDAVLVAGTGNDTLIGGNGNDTFVYSSADGNLDIQDIPLWWWSSNTNTLQFTDLNVADLSFARVGYGYSLAITVNSTGKTITIDNEYVTDYPEIGNNGLQIIRFADGTTWTTPDILAAGWRHIGSGVTQSISGDNLWIAVADAANVTVDGASNMVELDGDGSSVLGTGDGDGVDLRGNNDTATLSGNGQYVSSAGVGESIAVRGDEASVNSWGNDATITVDGDYGSVMSDANDATITVSGASEQVVSFADGATITLQGDNGSISSSGSNASILLTGDNENLALYSDPVGDNASVTLTGNNSSVSATSDNARIAINGDNGNVQLYSDSESVVLAGGGEIVGYLGTNGTVAIGGNSGDTVVYNLVAGNLDIQDLASWAWGGVANDNTLQFADLNVSDLTFARVDSTLEITVNSTGAVITVDSEFAYNSWGNNAIQQIQFADGTSWSNAQIAASAPLTVTGDDISVTMGVVGDVAILSGNADSITAAGDNESVTSTGTGNAISLTGTQDTATVGGTSNSLTSSGIGNSIYVTGSNESLSLSNASATLAEGASAEVNGDDNAIFGQGSANLVVTGNGNNLTAGTGDATLTATGNGNTLHAGAGNDVLTATGSGNAFAVGAGDGNDIVHASASGGSDAVAFGTGIAYDQLWFAQSNGDLVISVIGQNQSETIAGWYASSDNHIGEVTTSDGSSISDSGVQQLVEAMASFSQPGAGQTTLPPDLASRLAPALTANWQHA